MADNLDIQEFKIDDNEIPDAVLNAGGFNKAKKKTTQEAS